MEVYPNFVQQYPYWEPTSKIATKEKYTLFYNKNNTVILNVAFLQRLVISKNSAAEYEPLIIEWNRRHAFNPPFQHLHCVR